MLIYPNVPGWSGGEVRNTLAVLLRSSAATQQRHQLRTSIEADAAGWSAVLVASGRYALKLAIEVTGLGGGRLGAPAYVCPAVLTAARAAGATLVPIDCRADSLRFDSAALKQAVDSGHVDGIIATNTYGFDQDFAFLRQLGVPIIDDAAYQAGRVDRQGQPCGTRGDAGVWSFNFKALSGLGGGVLLLPKRSDATQPVETQQSRGDFSRWLNYGARSLMRHHIPKSIAPFRAADSTAAIRPAWLKLPQGSMSPLQVAVNLAQWQQRAALRRAEASARSALISEIAASEAFTTIEGSEDGTHFVPVLVERWGTDAAEAVARARHSLHADGIQTETAYPVLLGPLASTPLAIALAARLFLLPCHPALEQTQINHIRIALARAAGRLGGSAQLSAKAVAETT